MKRTIAMFPGNSLSYGKSEDLLTDDTLSRLYEVEIKRVLISENNQYVCIKKQK